MATFFKGVDLDTIVPLTMQQVYDNALSGVVGQGGFSSASDGTCRYREKVEETGKVLRCGIGHSIPEEWQVQEGCGVSSLIGADPRVQVLFSCLPVSDLELIQRAHDHCSRTGESIETFKKIMFFLAGAVGCHCPYPVYPSPSTPSKG